MNGFIIEGIKLATRVALMTALCFALSQTNASSYAKEQHVTGRVLHTSSMSVTIKTPAGQILTVGLDAKTSIRGNNQRLQKSSINAGDRITIQAENINGKLIAHSVQVGAWLMPL